MPAGKTTEKTICCIYPRAEHGVGRTLHCMENPRMENHCIDCRKPMYGNQCMKNQCMENQCKKLQKYGKPMYLLSWGRRVFQFGVPVCSHLALVRFGAPPSPGVGGRLGKVPQRGPPLSPPAQCL